MEIRKECLREQPLFPNEDEDIKDGIREGH
jgi:hypothetical protein